MERDWKHGKEVHHRITWYSKRGKNAVDLPNRRVTFDMPHAKTRVPLA
jgi:hypothetical protein